MLIPSAPVSTTQKIHTENEGRLGFPANKQKQKKKKERRRRQREEDACFAMAHEQRPCSVAPRDPFLLLLLLFLALFFLPASAYQIRPAPAGFDGPRSLKLRLLRRNALNLPTISLPDESPEQIHGTLYSGASFPGNVGQYFVELYLGNPGKPYFFIIDTGSDVMWIPCSRCDTDANANDGNQSNPNSGGGGDGSNNPNVANGSCGDGKNSSSVFMAKSSATFEPIPCPSDACYYVPPPQGAPACHVNQPSECTYSYAYSDGSRTAGVYAYDTVRMLASSMMPSPGRHEEEEAGHMVELGRVAFGCGTDNSRPGSIGLVGGVLGLGLGPISFFSQLGGNRIYGQKFSYCFSSFFHAANLTSAITFGEDPMAAKLRPRMQYAPFSENPRSRGLYYVSIDSMRVDGVDLAISPDVWRINRDGKGGAILDSGTTLSFFPPLAYDAIVGAIKRVVSYPVAPATAGLPLCYNVSGIDFPKLPRISIVLKGSRQAVFSPPPNNYFLRPEENLRCLGLKESPAQSPSILGNLLQQNFYVEYDKKNSRIGFAKARCATLVD